MGDGDSLSRQSQVAAGTVVSLWRYPVKSMMGEELKFFICNGSWTRRGSDICGNRQTSGKVASAKNPRKWGSSSTFVLHIKTHHRLSRYSTSSNYLPRWYQYYV